jgi:RNA polymerase sigma-70 factor, ECF subfamily
MAASRESNPRRIGVAAADESALIARILTGETQMFHDLVRPYERLVYVSIFAIVKSEGEAEDGAQETMTNAFRFLASFRGECEFSTWLMSIAVNEARVRLRKAKLGAEYSFDQRTDHGKNDFGFVILKDSRDIPLAALERKELRRKVREAVRALPQKYREVSVLRDIQELNQEETAAVLGINTTLVKVRLHRARMMLQKRLVPYVDRKPKLLNQAKRESTISLVRASATNLIQSVQRTKSPAPKGRLERGTR